MILRLKLLFLTVFMATALLVTLWPGKRSLPVQSQAADPVAYPIPIEYGGTQSSTPQQLLTLSTTSLFLADDGIHGRELWLTDGTLTGTQLIDIRPGAESSQPQMMAVMKGKAYFVADDGVAGRELWGSDGTITGTHRVKDIAPGLAGSFPVASEWIVLTDTLYFVADDGNVGSELWRTDGTLSGTHLVQDIFMGTESANPRQLTVGDDSVCFSADDGENGRELWCSDGTTAGTQLVRDIYPGSMGSSCCGEMLVWQDTLYFTANDGQHGTELWRSDRSFTGTTMIADLYVEGQWYSEHKPYPSLLTPSDTQLYFTYHNYGGVLYPDKFPEIWATDGTEDGTQLVSDEFAYDCSPQIAELHPLADTVFMVITQYSYYAYPGFCDWNQTWQELWMMPGTMTTPLQLTGLANPTDLTTFNEWLFFQAETHAIGTELWRSDGTVSGTVLVKDINPYGSSNPQQLQPFSDVLYFTADDGPHGHEIWRTDGTLTGTERVADINPLAGHADPIPLGQYGDLLFWQAGNGRYGDELWVTKIGETGAWLVADLNQLRHQQSDPTNLLAADGQVYFAATTADFGRELWRTDGTITNTRLVSDINSGGGHSNPQMMTYRPEGARGDLFFTAETYQYGRELWRSAGDSSETIFLGDLTPGVDSLAVDKWLLVDDVLYWVQCNDVLRTDGTVAGTYHLAQVNACINDWLYYDGRLFVTLHWFGLKLSHTSLIAIDSVTGDDTSLLDFSGVAYDTAYANLTPVNDKLFFTGPRYADYWHEISLWMSDGTKEGTVVITSTVPGFVPGNDLIEFEDQLFLAASDPANGDRLWRSDGTPDGTYPLQATGNKPQKFIIFNDQLFFVTEAAVGGTMLWRSDGTSVGTYGLKTIGSVPLAYMIVNGQLLFTTATANDGTILWRSDGTANGTVPLGSWAGKLQEFVTELDRLIFVASESSGDSIWVTDGTFAGTQQLFGPVNAIPELVYENGWIYFIVDETDNGRQLWILPYVTFSNQTFLPLVFR